TLRARRRILAVRPPILAPGAGEHGDAVTPPELSRDVPVADVLHPVLIRRAPALGHEPDLPRAVRLEGGLRERLHLHEPLIAEPRLDHRAAAVAVAHGVAVGLDLLEEPPLLEEIYDLGARVEPIEARQRLRDPRGVLHAGVLGHHDRHLELVAEANFEIGRVVCRGDFHGAGTELGHY